MQSFKETCMYLVVLMQVEVKGRGMARCAAQLQQDLAGTKREVLFEVIGPPGYQLQTDRHQTDSLKGATQ